MSLKIKMILICLFIASAGLGTAVMGYRSLSQVTAEYNPIATENLPLVLDLGDLRGAFRELRIQIRSIAFVGTRSEDVKTYVDAALLQLAEVERHFATYEQIDKDARHRPSYQELKASWEDFKKFGEALVDKSKNYEANQAVIVQMIREICPVKANAVYKALDIETNLQMAEVKKSTEQALSTEANAKTLTVIFSVVALLVAFAVSYVFSTKLSSKISQIASDLTDENSQVTQAVQNMAHSGEKLSSSSTQAAAALEETVASIEELTSMVKFNSDTAKEAAGISASSKEAAERGEKEISSLISSMTGISESSKKIKDIISVIDDIAFQTNLLALNAAVEAARAGEQGKGFAVVADAVRSLAQRSASAAKDISNLIQESVDKIQKGSEIANQSSVVLQNIVSSVNRVSDLNREIAEASSEQATGIQQISKAMTELDVSVQNNAVSAKEIAGISHEINGLAESALKMTNEVNETIMGRSKAA